ncbi:hypothetical protein KR51_00001420 [Rubidibacter lacunae KORDI 51-2]|uniref:Uncharacterized protein n=1 Tax=Rubidibacter lacunae KORDI 51-2 TaxID=582515 RepID=U5DN48_9CHRO|nr:hypothetical protein [Rubidibacter lacunae]ERN43081.1 hypothetical protein KR51_00001420 [Rubidibacter lacunae KORDI 51-2]
MNPLLKFGIIAAHFSVYVVAAVSIWIFSRRSEFFTSILKVRSLPLIYFGYAAFAIGSSYEIAEHIGDNWIYISQISSLNRLFYTFVNAGVCSIALGLRKSRWLDILLIGSLIAVPLTYGIHNSKTIMNFIQLISAIIFVWNWYIVMRDWRVFLYVVFANFMTFAFGIVLIITGNQVLHIFVGLSAAVALLILGYVAWVQPRQHLY